MSSTIDQSTEFIISQTRSNIQFLQSINKISSDDARRILSKLPSSDYSLEVRQNSLPRHSPSNVRAIWSYNGSGQDPKNLTFNSGDIIQVTDQTNSDWWTGRLNGREGVFPSSYVEKAPPTPQPHYEQRPPPMPRQSPANFPGPNYPTGPPGYPQQPQYYPPPPPGNMYSPNLMPPPGGRPYPPVQGPQGPVVIEQPPKKHGKSSGGDLGSTLVHSAVGGAGFGAGTHY